MLIFVLIILAKKTNPKEWIKMEVMGMTLQELMLLAQDKKWKQIKVALLDMQVADIAELIDELDQKTALMVFRLLPKELAAEVFSYLEGETQVRISQLVSEKELREILDELFFDDMIDFLEEVPANAVKKILLNTPETERALINQFLNYPDNSAGSVMTIEFVDLRKEMTVREALDKIRRTALEKETIYTCYVMDNQRHLEGLVTLKDIVLSDPDQKIELIMQEDVISVSTWDDKEFTAHLMQKHNLMAIPVTDHEKRLVGIITVDDILDVIEEAATEDIHKMAATVGELSSSVVSARPLELLKNRLPWLLVLIFVNILSGAGLAYYEETIQSVVALVFFLPLLIDSAGNAGTQSSALMIRAIATGDVVMSDWLKLLRKELIVSVMLGGSMGLAVSVLGVLRGGVDVAVIVSISMMVIVVIGSLIGMLLPFLLKKLKLDPAAASGPLVTSIADIMGVWVYFTIAAWYFGF